MMNLGACFSKINITLINIFNENEFTNYNQNFTYSKVAKDIYFEEKNIGCEEIVTLGPYVVPHEEMKMKLSFHI